LEEQNIDISKIEIRSEEVQEILGTPPRWIIRAGISVILAVVVVLLIGSWFFKYPDVIGSQISLTTENPPASLKAKTTGKITHLFCEENQTVEQDLIIGIIENTANYQDIQKLKTLIDTNPTFDIELSNLHFNLGELQQSYSSFSRLLKDYQAFKELDYYQMKIQSVKQQQYDYNLYYNRLWKQRTIQEQELKLAETQYQRDKELYENGVYAKADFEKAEKTYLQQKLSFESARTTLANTQMQINQLDQQILDLKLQESQELNRQEIAIQESLENLKSQLKLWEQTYLIKTPIDGKVTFTKVWSTNQNVQTGEIVATVIPEKESNIIGKVEIAATGVGKVKIGQTVNIKFDNFPHMEFGMLKGKVKSISLVPTMTDKAAIYTAEIEIPDTLVSNYGKELKFSQEMTGTAEIITDDVRLLQRFLNPLKFIWKQSVE
jgi:HlyD family secretion protein